MKEISRGTSLPGIPSPAGGGFRGIAPEIYLPRLARGLVSILKIMIAEQGSESLLLRLARCRKTSLRTSHPAIYCGR